MLGKKRKIDITSYNVSIKLVSGEEYNFISVLYMFHCNQHCFTLLNGMSIAFPVGLIDSLEKIKIEKKEVN